MNPLDSVPLSVVLRVLAIVLVVLLMMIFAIIYMSRKRGERVERKIDAIGVALGISAHFAHLDEEHGRRSLYAAFDHGLNESGWEGSSSRRMPGRPPVVGDRPPPKPRK